MSRRLDLSRFGGGDDDDDDGDNDAFPLANPKLALGKEKQHTFSHGIQRKTKRDLEREHAKRKQEEEERDAARVFAEFAADFDGAGPSASSSRPGGGFVRAGGGSYDAYVPSKPPPDRGPRQFRDASPPPASSAPKPKGKRAMDSFLEEMKKDQAAREERFRRSGGVGGSVSVHAAWERERGSHDMGDTLTTNLYVGNLPEAAREPALGMLFAKIGPVGSVKIFYPRFDEPPPGADAQALQSRRVGMKHGMTGFVAFMSRHDAERAVKEYDGLDWGGSVLKVSWSKAVKLPRVPVYALPSHSGSSKRPRSRSRSRSPPPAHKRNRSASPPPRHHPSASSGRSSPPPVRAGGQPMPDFGLPLETERFIRTVAERVRTVGGAFEESLRQREGTEGKWRFLDPAADLPECHFYRLLVDPSYRLPSPPPRPFTDDGYCSTYSTDPSEASEDERVPKGKLGRLARRRFASCLRGMRGDRGSIARVMAMALKHADAADEIADTIVQSLLIFETPIPVKLARLHLISDILSNSACPLPNAWKYRNVFEARLAPAFDHFGDLYTSFKAQAGRLTAETFRGQVAAVLDVLDIWIVFPPAYIQELRLRLAGHKPKPSALPNQPLTAPSAPSSPSPAAAPSAPAGATDPPAAAGAQRAPAPSRFKKSAFAPASADAPAAREAALPALGGLGAGGGKEEEEEEEEEDLDGAPMEEDLDGAPLEEEDLDGAPLDEEDVDGAPLAVDVDLDGEAL